jgi:hypothetical protein
MIFRAVTAATLAFLLLTDVAAQQVQSSEASTPGLPDAPSMVAQSQQDQSQQGNVQQPEPGPDTKLGESSKPKQNSASTQPGLQQPKRILFIIPNYRAVSADAQVPPLDSSGKFKLFLDDSFDYSTFLSVAIIAGIGMADRNVPQFGDGADAYARYYYHYFGDQAVGNFFTEFTIPTLLKQDPRYYTLGRGSFLKRSGYAVSRLVITRTDSGGSAINFSEIVGNGAAAGISGLYYPAGYETWTKTGQRWADQLALDAVFNVLKEFWPDIRHSVFRK